MMLTSLLSTANYFDVQAAGARLDWGAHARVVAAGALAGDFLAMNDKLNYECCRVFREGAERRTRGACTPRMKSEYDK